MSIINYNQENLIEMRTLLAQLTDDQYERSLDILSGASIGQHVRHILEFYVCLLKAQETGAICYDDRERNTRIETDRQFALMVTKNIMLTLGKINSDRPVKLRADFSSSGGKQTILDTSLFRELAYDLEHSIHHQALIKIALADMGVKIITEKNFGIAPSTVRHHGR
jgi:hypothetical protein